MKGWLGVGDSGRGLPLNHGGWRIVACLLVSSLPVWAGGLQLDHLRGGVLAVYEGTNTQPVATLRFKETHPGSRRLGFFRFGLAPVCIGQEVQVHLRTTEKAGAHLAAITRLLERSTRQHQQQPLELQGFDLFFPNESVPRFHANRVCCETDGQWGLTDGVVLRAGAESLSASSGSLFLAGPRAGSIELCVGATRRVVQLLEPDTGLGSSSAQGGTLSVRNPTNEKE